MKKNILGAAVLAAILASGALSACSGSPKETTAAATETQAADSRAEDTTAAEAETTQASAELKEIVVGASPAPHAEILNAAKEVLASKGYELKIVEYTDYVQPNNALDSSTSHIWIPLMSRTEQIWSAQAPSTMSHSVFMQARQHPWKNYRTRRPYWCQTM